MSRDHQQYEMAQFQNPNFTRIIPAGSRNTKLANSPMPDSYYPSQHTNSMHQTHMAQQQQQQQQQLHPRDHPMKLASDQRMSPIPMGLGEPPHMPRGPTGTPGGIIPGQRPIHHPHTPQQQQQQQQQIHQAEQLQPHQAPQLQAQRQMHIAEDPGRPFEPYEPLPAEMGSYSPRRPPYGAQEITPQQQLHQQGMQHQIRTPGLTEQQLLQHQVLRANSGASRGYGTPQNASPQHTPVSRSVSQTSRRSSVSSGLDSPLLVGTSGARPMSDSFSSINARKRSSIRSGQDESEREMKRVARENCEIPLEEYAARLRANTAEGQASEKEKQIFGMTWLLKSCEVNPDSVVPRNRIYARYVSLCADNGLKPLSPASFGKLVRVLFPNIRTRRLGTRGQSKYHYCGIKLLGVDNTPSGSSTPVIGGRMTGFSPDSSFASQLSPVNTPESTKTRTVQSGMDTPASENSEPAEECSVPLAFLPDVQPESLTSYSPGVIQLPSIAEYLPADCDKDAAETLSGLFRAHIGQVVESIRFMHVKKMLGQMTSFYSSLISPVQKIFLLPQVAEWIQLADLQMYREMLQMVSPLALQEAPPQVLSILRNLSSSLVVTLRASYVSSELHEDLIRRRLIPAKIFCGLLRRLIRVNETAQAAGKILAHPPDRNLMRSDWVNSVDFPSIVNSELSCGATEKEKAVEILRVQVPKLLLFGGKNSAEKVPGNAGTAEGSGAKNPAEAEEEFRQQQGNQATTDGGQNSENMRAEYEYDIYKDGQSGKQTMDGNFTENGKSSGDEEQTTMEEIIVKWASFLLSLPKIFPHVHTRLFLLFMSSVLTTTLREITLSGGAGFGGWWIVRCWVDEWMGFSAEKGGFLTKIPWKCGNSLKQEHTHTHDERDTIMKTGEMSSSNFGEQSDNSNRQYQSYSDFQREGSSEVPEKNSLPENSNAMGILPIQVNQLEMNELDQIMGGSNYN